MSVITIVGAGNSGCAHACELTSLGHEVRILKTSNRMHDDNYDKIKAAGGIRCIDNTRSTDTFYPIATITRDPEEAFRGAEFVYVLTQSLQHGEIAKRIAPYIQNIKAVMIVPGNMGSMYFRPLLPPGVIVAEGESTIIDARISEPGTVNILFRNVRNALSFNPCADTEKGFALFRRISPSYTHTRSNVVETAMHNPNMVVHTIGTIMSANRIELTGGEFWMYREAFSPSIWNLVNALDAEKNAVIEAYGGCPQSYLECCKFRNEEDLTVDAMDVFRRYAEEGSPKGPASIHNRYLEEDVPNGLCLLSSLAKSAGIDTPMADALITIASTISGNDFIDDARTVEQLGLIADRDAICKRL